MRKCDGVIQVESDTLCQNATTDQWLDGIILLLICRIPNQHYELVYYWQLTFTSICQQHYHACVLLAQLRWSVSGGSHTAASQ